MAPERLPISVCFIAGNEAHRIRRALESVVGWTSEIIVVINDDVGDGTDKIAASFGAKVFREPWKGFGTQKNSAAKKATCDWLLGLDADEVVSSGLRAEIKQLFAQPEKLRRHVAYNFPRCTLFCGRWIRHGDWHPDRQTRLWRRGRAHWSSSPVHEKLEVDGSIGRLRAELQHYMAETIDRQINKISAYTEALLDSPQSREHRTGMLDMLARPSWRFVRTYFFRLGFLDGWQGLYIAWMTAFYVATRQAKWLAAQDEKLKIK
ncbi:MAG: glycosyltransferase family 2 protein [Verrucomicrobiia bacterium]